LLVLPLYCTACIETHTSICYYSDYASVVGDYASVVGDYASVVGDYASVVGDYAAFYAGVAGIET